ncbi:MAG: cytochrome C oxidase subunit IV family protein [Bdellovibrionales bacterium]|nr:cytochrome C oxidase subunit IV family protein [Bdellovibrionales bacterium]
MSEHHTVPFKTYLSVLIILLFLTVITVAVAQIDFGAWNTFIAMFIASVKGALVLLYFMHLKYEDRLYWVIFGSGVFFVVLLFFLTKIDIITRVLEVNTL